MKKEYVELDLKKIFFTPPTGKREKISLFLILLVSFIFFFGPLCFSAIHPVKAICLSAGAALSISWGFTVFLRSLFQKKTFSK